MRVIHRRDIIRRVRDSWMRQYKPHADSDVTGWDRNLTFGQVRKALNALDLETCQPDDVNAALGVHGWADNDCDECSKSFPILIHIGDEPDYEARYQDLCAECLDTAMHKLRSTEALP